MRKFLIALAALCFCTAAALPSVDSLLERDIRIQPIQIIVPMQDPHLTRVQTLLDTTYKKYNPDPKLAFWVSEASKLYDVRADVILAMMAAESSFSEKAYNKRTRAAGLMQIRHGIWGYSRNELMDYRRNIMQGADILSQYLRENNGNYRKSLQAYNVGITAYRKGVRAPKYTAKISRYTTI